MSRKSTVPGMLMLNEYILLDALDQATLAFKHLPIVIQNSPAPMRIEAWKRKYRMTYLREIVARMPISANEQKDSCLALRRQTSKFRKANDLKNWGSGRWG